MMGEKKNVDPELRAFVEDVIAGIFNAGYLFEKDEVKANIIIRRIIHEKVSKLEEQKKCTVG